MPSTSRFFVFLFSAIVSLSVSAAGTKERLFSGAYLAQTAANDIDAEFLAPSNYTSAAETMAVAEKLYAKKKPIEKVQAKLVKAIGFYEQAVKASAKAEKTLAVTLRARTDARGVDAQKYSQKNWLKAEKVLTKAIAELEGGDLNGAKSLAEKATELYRATELVAIKAEYLDETRRLIKRAKDARVYKYAPVTLRKAEELLATAEVELTENRYDVDLPRSLAREARYEVNHAFYLAEHIKKIRKQDLNEEDIILQYEAPLQTVAAAADINAQFDQGVQPVADEVIVHIEKANAGIQEYKQQLADKDMQIAGLREHLDEFAKLYGGEGSSAADLEKHLAEQQMMQQRVKRLESMFDRSEARVFRDSRELYIRLVGLSFASGSASVSRNGAGLLDKVTSALKLFPNSRVIVEGHTDSFGGDDSNLILSKNRAQSVRRFLVTRLNIANNAIEAIGFGETKPFANNDTLQGRALNRRIDIRIIPPSNKKQTAGL